MDNSPWDSNAIFIYVRHLSVPSQKSASFLEILLRSQSSPPPRAPPSPLTKVNLWGEVRGWTGVYLMEKASEKQVSLDFCP